ncbi:MAG TPA: ABC transporter ATP-binding protein [Gemmatimonadaceae bacterium]|nr:ABC transporter ATP-binding protein [Gemmatimonadaceae bacterium]
MTFSVAAGEVFGIAGPNGAGKSTMLSMLLGFMPPSDGTIRVDGAEPRAFVEREGIGYLSELVAINPRWRTHDTLVRFALLAGLPDHEVERQVDEVETLLALGEHAGKKVKELSKGTAQRLALGQALLGETRVMVFDEPTHGLDPLWMQRFRELVPTLRRPDRAILIASHNLDELERLADRVAIVDRGGLQRIVDVRDGRGAAVASRYRLVTRGPAAAVESRFPGAVRVGEGEHEVAVESLESLNAALATLIASGTLVVSVSPAHSTLEEHFRQVVADTERA